MAVRNDTILIGLRQEYDRIEEMLHMDRKQLEATRDALKHTMAIYEARVTKDAQTRLPKTLKAAVKLRNENGNGQRKISGAQLQRERIVAILRSVQTGRHPGKQASVYLRHGYIAHNNNGTYSITPTGKKKLAELTDSDAPTP